MKKYAIKNLTLLSLLFLTTCLPSLRSVQADNRPNLFKYSPTKCAQILSDYVEAAKRAPASMQFRYEHFKKLDARQKEFVEKVLLPEIGKRVLRDSKNLRTLMNEDGVLKFGNLNEAIKLEVAWEKDLKEPEIREFKEGRIRRLVLPEDLTTNEFLGHYDILQDHWKQESKPGFDEARQWIRTLTLGHPLHPFILDANKTEAKERKALKEPIFLLREVQQEAMDAGDGARARGDKEFLPLAPTGVGKTVVLIDRLKKEIRDPQLSERGLNLKIILADQNGHVEQLVKDVEALNPQSRRSATLKLKKSKRTVKVETIYLPDEEIEGKTLRFRFVQFGAGKGKKITIEDLKELSEQEKDPIVVATTIQSLKQKIFKSKRSADENFEDIHSMLSTILWDEVHHAGAREAKELIEKLVYSPESSAFIEGTTATLIHRFTDMFKLFQGKVFQMYLHRAQDWLDSVVEQSVRIKQILDQLSLAITSGELTPPRFSYFDPNSILPGGKSIFIKRGNVSGPGGRYVIDPKYYGVVAAKILPFLLKHEYGLITARDVDEVNAITEFLNNLFERMLAEGQISTDQMRTFKALHSDVPKGEQTTIREGARNRQFNFLITRFMGDEALNFPHFSVYIDLNRSVGPRQLLQRMGRVTRLFANKLYADVVSFMSLNESTLGESLEVIQRINQGDLNKNRIIKAEKQVRLPKAIVLEDNTLVEVKAITDQDRVSLNKKIESQLREFWLKKETVAKDLEKFVESNGRLPSDNSTDTAELSLASKIIHYLKKDFHEEFWNLLNERTQKLLEFSDLNFKPIMDVRPELENLAQELDSTGAAKISWSQSTRNKRIREAVRRAMRRNPTFLASLKDDDVREVAISALTQEEALRIRLGKWWELHKTLPDPFAPDSSESELSLELRKWTMKNGKNNFVLSLPTDMQQAIKESKQDFDPHRTLIERLENFRSIQFSNRRVDADGYEFYKYKWNSHPISESLQNLIRSLYFQSPEFVQNLEVQALALPYDLLQGSLVDLFISALRPEDRSLEHLKRYYNIHAQKLPTAPRAGLEVEMFEEIHEVLKANPNWIKRLPVDLAKVIESHPYFDDLIADHSQIAVAFATIDVKWPISQQLEADFYHDLVNYILKEDRPPGMPKVGKQFIMRKRGFDKIEIQFVARLARLLDVNSIEVVRKKILQTSPTNSTFLQAVLTRSKFLEITQAKKDWTFLEGMREITKFFKTTGAIPTVKTDPKAFKRMSDLLTEYPPLIDYFNTEVQMHLRATQLWKTIVGSLKIKE